ncbi:MAG TPA: ABC transporter permease [Patescibacteria group bacterium]|jgi:putative ABC transport system permease protein|nr:ABC transporter permease [Patescibacteria group bacterium]
MVDIKIALKALYATKARTALTMLGIMVGVASITVVMSLGEGAKQKVQDQVSQLGSDMLTIRPGQASRDKNGIITNYNFLAALGASTISEQDFETVKKTPGVVMASPIMVINGSINTVPKTTAAKGMSIIATNTDFDKLFKLKLRSGEFLNTATSRETVVLGQELAIEMLGSDTVIGHKILIRGQEFTVIGVLDRTNNQTNFSNIYNFNRTAFIQTDAGKAFNQGIAQIQQVNVRVATSANARDIGRQLQQAILANHGGEEDFTILNPEESIKITNDLIKTLTTLTAAVASVSLIVGGIGIMNIMLVSITERTREIGIRKSVGATSAQILRQFLIEALTMSVVGGLIGVVLAYGVAFVIGTYLDFLPIITWRIALIAFTVSTIIGVTFGLAPAIKAARKDPIEALRFFN